MLCILALYIENIGNSCQNAGVSKVICMHFVESCSSDLVNHKLFVVTRMAEAKMQKLQIRIFYAEHKSNNLKRKSTNRKTQDSKHKMKDVRRYL